MRSRCRRIGRHFHMTRGLDAVLRDPMADSDDGIAHFTGEALNSDGMQS